ncbi:roadblock/LC7 domain-containing protein [Actinomycetes bacterium KLBMP 9797]
MTTPRSNWSFLLDDLCRIPGIANALAVSSDGLLIARSTKLPKDHADQLAAFTSGLASLTNGIASLMNASPVEQTVVDMNDGRIVIMAIGDGSVLTVLAAKSADMGQVAYEMAMLINRVGAALTPAPHVPARA